MSPSSYCEDPFWDSELTLGSWPQFTECFQDTLLAYVPCGWLWLAGPFYACYLARSPAVPSRDYVSNLTIAKLVTTVFVGVVCVMELVDRILHLPGDDWVSARVFSPAITILTLILAFTFTIAEHKRRFVTSGVQFLFWGIMILCNIIPFYSNILQHTYDDRHFDFVIFMLKFAFALMAFLLFCKAEKCAVETYGEQLSPEARSSFLSRMSYWWLNGLMIKSFRKPLTESTVPSLHTRDKSKTVVPTFLSNWTKAVVKAQRTVASSFDEFVIPDMTGARSVNTFDRVRSDSYSSKKDSLDKEQLIQPEVGFKQKGPSLAKILFKTFWAEFLISQLWKLLYDILMFAIPLLLGVLIAFIKDPTVEPWKGYVYASALFACTVLQSVLFHQLFHQLNALGIRVRASLISAIFRKALTLDPSANRAQTSGEVVNLISLDTDHIEQTMGYMWAIWSSPLQIILAMYFLYLRLGPAVFAGAGFLILLIPLNGVLTAIQGRLEEKMLKLKDDRMAIMNELLGGIKIVKLFAWEKSFQQRILDVRNAELGALFKMALAASVQTFSWTVAPFVVSLLSYLCYVKFTDDHNLDAETAFVAMSLFDILRFAINFAPMVITDLIKAVISTRRIERYLSLSDLDANSVTRDDREPHAITISNGTFEWSPEVETTLKNINLSVPDNSLVAIVGAVGSGKSSLLSALLGNIRKTTGRVNMRGRIAYVPQEAWIQNCTLRENILFGRSYDHDLYTQCIEACALKHDLDILTAGDMTEIGEKGINLSGGQKQRVSLARAVYAQADVYLLDDPLSAVDAHVGRHIFKHVLSRKGFLAGRTRVLVTHGIQWLPSTDQVIVMDKGTIREAGHYEELLSHNGAFAHFITTHLTQEVEEDDYFSSEEGEKLKQLILRRLSESEDSGTIGNEEGSISDREKLLMQLSQGSSSKAKGAEGRKTEVDEEAAVSSVKKQNQGALTQEEHVEVGKVKFMVIKQYGAAIGSIYLFFIVLAYALYMGSDSGSLLWLRKWTDDEDLGNFTTMPRNSSERQDKNDFYIGIYGLFGVLQTLAIIAYSFLQNLRFMSASKQLHEAMLSRVLHAPISFFDTTPLGRIINRFSNDVDQLDQAIPMTFNQWIDCLFTIITSFVVIMFSLPIFIPFMVPFVILYLLVQRFYIPTSRQLKRLGSKTKSPIFNHFSETLSGSPVIRAYGVQQEFIQESERRVDKNHVFLSTNYSSNRWLGFRLEIIGSLTILAIAFIAVSSHSTTGGLLGLVLTYSLTLTDNLNWFVRMTSDLETQIVCAERILEYTEVENEAPWESLTHSPVGWPDSGRVVFDRLSLRYREGLDLVLKSLSFEIKASEKVGIVGRTGAGKSSLTLALFRLVEPANGRILIDNVDISMLGLHDLRSKVTILPQDPVIFKGSLRQNLDPCEEHDLSAIWTALEHCHLATFVRSLPEQLEYDCGEGGECLSVGQRQLLCLGRALLRKTKILVLDEATAAVDMDTDVLIQDTIRQEFHDCTILTIAHRLNTVMDYDRILVLDKGQVNSFDSPANLLQDTDGLFFSMAKSAGLA